MKDFDGQHNGEEVLFVFRRHMIAMRKGFYLLLIPFLVGSLPTLLLPLLPSSFLPPWWADPVHLVMIALTGLGIGLVF